MTRRGPLTAARSAGPSATCSFRFRTRTIGVTPISYATFNVTTFGWIIDPRGCSRGLLDNLRGQVGRGEAREWTCDYSPDQASTFTTFRVSNDVQDSGRHVQDAIYLASPGQSVTGVVCKKENERGH